MWKPKDKFRKKYGHEFSKQQLPLHNGSGDKWQPDTIDKCMLLADNHKPTERDEFYKREIFYLYLELGSYRAVEDAVGIPKSSIRDTVLSYAESIKQKV